MVIVCGIDHIHLDIYGFDIAQTVLFMSRNIHLGPHIHASTCMRQLACQLVYVCPTFTRQLDRCIQVDAYKLLLLQVVIQADG